MKLLHTSLIESCGADYFRCRIPGIVALENGDALLCCECRLSDSDWDAAAIGMRRVSPDGTVGSRMILARGAAVNNPVMIADGETVHFLHCTAYRRIFYRRSLDCGRTWSNPKEITAQLDACLNGYFFNAVAVGPCHGVRHASGRLIVPVWIAYNKDDPHAHHPSVIAALYSDDGGENWSLSEIIPTSGLCDPSETAIAELPDGRLMINIRNENADRRRRTMTSRDGGLHWEDLKTADALPDPVCCAGLCRRGEQLLFTNCESEQRRENLTVKLLDPDGSVLDSLLISEAGGYSDVCAFPGGGAIVFFERDRELCLARIDTTI